MLPYHRNETRDVTVVGSASRFISVVGHIALLIGEAAVDELVTVFSSLFVYFPLVVWVCTAALAILDRLDVVDLPTLGWWLAERQLPNGGMNGRPEKLEDVCITFIFCGDEPIAR
jgi:hypothetical protein